MCYGEGRQLIMNYLQTENVVICHDDLPIEYFDSIIMAKIVAWDIETSGLNWRTDRMGICQLHTPDKPVVIVKISETPPKILKSLLKDSSIKKVFHHAMFDLRFMVHNWKVTPKNIACTKIASKILDPEKRNNHNLQSLLKVYLGLEKDKSEQLSDWLSSELTKEQIRYAVNDVIYLIQLLHVLENELKSNGLIELAHECFAHIPTRVKLDLLGYEDIFSY